ncbi:Long-chain specific acyl-CoA dehydrogenase, mitochondrial [Varanus komodoensis]|nr:Long-chain specific acyl-CoA dehydrogenase, mitochondrial [Varanus komodoensis]
MHSPERWEKAGQVSREVWEKAGQQGFLGVNIAEEHGGIGGDLFSTAIVWEEQMYANCSGPGFSLHSDIVMPYIANYGTKEQIERFIPEMTAGRCIGAIAMTEPGAGSDLQGVRTFAKKDGSDWILNGSKVFITNGWMCDVVIVVAVTNREAHSPAHGISLFLVENGMKGFIKGRKLEKIGLKAQDTAEMFFEDVRLPASALLGQENKGFYYLMAELPQERLAIADMAIASCEFMFEETRNYVKQRKAFGKTIAHLQTVQHKLAELKTQICIGRTFLDSCLHLHSGKRLDSSTASMAKYWYYLCHENPKDSTKRQKDTTPEDEPLRSEGVQYATGEEQRASTSSAKKNEATGSKPKGHSVADVSGGERKVQCCKDLYSIGTWNVRSMSQGKLDVVKQEMTRLNIDLLGISELKWTGMGELNSDDHKRRLYTWTSPNGQQRNQIDYVLCSQRWRSIIQSVKTRPGADCGSDHELLVAKFRLKLKKVGKSTRPLRYDLNHIPDEYTVEVANRFKELDLIDRVPEELWTEVRNIVQEVATKAIPKKKKCKKAKWLSEEALQIAERIARRDKDAFFNEQCKEIEENNRKGRTRDLFKNIGDMKGTFHAKMGMIKDQNGRDLTEAEEIKKR